MKTIASRGETLVGDNLLVIELSDDRPMVDICERVWDKPYTSFLDTSLEMRRFGRYSFLGFEPFAVLQTKGMTAEFLMRDDNSYTIEHINPFDALGKVLGWVKLAEPEAGLDLPPFLGGGIGYLAYELGRYVESLPDTVEDDLGLPELSFSFFDHVIACDHRTKSKYLAVSPAPGQPSDVCALRDKAERALAAISDRQTTSPQVSRTGVMGNPSANVAGEADKNAGMGSGSGLEPRCNFTRESYLEAVRRIKEYILAGDIYQANLSQRFDAPFTGSPWSLYRRLRRLNSAPFSAFLNYDGFQVASSSPERFLKVTGDAVETRPIKGTRGRSEDPVEDDRLKSELLSSEKDRAELSMIVDLERNDLGRVCDYGTVEVEEHAVIETYATVHHLVSTVVGRLHRGKDIIGLLKASFPGGSITGAPKIRSIEIIDELEPTERSVYTGNIGYLGFNGKHDLNIAIRTMILKDSTAYFQLGGGIVADSDPEDEFRETLDKGRAIFRTVIGKEYPE